MFKSICAFNTLHKNVSSFSVLHYFLDITYNVFYTHYITLGKYFPRKHLKDAILIYDAYHLQSY